jgi:hypothetical protein
MPYLTESDKKYYGVTLDPFQVAVTPGQLNYQITQLCLEYLGKYPSKYQDYNDVIGALECAKLEMYRRKVVPYEDQKKFDNGDVF